MGNSNGRLDGPGTCWPSGWRDYSGVVLVSHGKCGGGSKGHVVRRTLPPCHWSTPPLRRHRGADLCSKGEWAFPARPFDEGKEPGSRRPTAASRLDRRRWWLLGLRCHLSLKWYANVSSSSWNGGMPGNR